MTRKSLVAMGPAGVLVIPAGIESDQLEVFFSRFTRLDPQASGTGIGLNIARTITRLHGGDLTATSRGPGTGATFILLLPAAPGRT